MHKPLSKLLLVDKYAQFKLFLVFDILKLKRGIESKYPEHMNTTTKYFLNLQNKSVKENNRKPEAHHFVERFQIMLKTSNSDQNIFMSQHHAFWLSSGATSVHDR